MRTQDAALRVCAAFFARARPSRWLPRPLALLPTPQHRLGGSLLHRLPLGVRQHGAAPRSSRPNLTNARPIARLRCAPRRRRSRSPPSPHSTRGARVVIRRTAAIGGELRVEDANRVHGPPLTASTPTHLSRFDESGRTAGKLHQWVTGRSPPLPTRRPLSPTGPRTRLQSAGDSGA
jgi:hypothetical protein